MFMRRWETVSVEAYLQAGRNFPPQAYALKKSIEVLDPTIKFEVSFLGTDPLLHVIKEDEFAHEVLERRTVLIWGNDGKTVLPPA